MGVDTYCDNPAERPGRPGGHHGQGLRHPDGVEGLLQRRAQGVYEEAPSVATLTMPADDPQRRPTGDGVGLREGVDRGAHAR